MNNNNPKQLLLIFVFLVFAGLLAAYTAFQNDLSIRDASATVTLGADYSGNSSNFTSNGETLGSRVFYTNTRADNVFRSRGFQVLDSLVFELGNIPAGSGLRACLVSYNSSLGLHKNVFCTAANSNDYKFEYSSNRKILVEPGTEYYCSFELFELSNTGGFIEEYLNANSLCSFSLKPFNELGSEESIVLPVNSGVLNSIAMGPELLAQGVVYSAVQDLKIVGGHASMAFDVNLPSQRIDNLCVYVDGVRAECVSGDEYIGGMSSLGNHLEFDVSIRRGQDFSFSCSTATGARGICEMYIFFEVSPDFISSQDSTNPLSRAHYYQADQSSISKYCEDSLLYYSNSPFFIGLDESIESSRSKVSRCQGLLSSSYF